jgi:hypothetical protein
VARPGAGTPEPPDPAETRAEFADLDWSAVREALPEDLTALDADLDGLDPFALDARMRDVPRAMRRIDWQTGRLLRVFLDRRLYRLMRFPSAGRYLTERLGLSARKARALVALERKTWEDEPFGTAYRAGDLSWVRALTILPVVAEPTGRNWVERAGEVSVRRLADEVEWALTVRDGLTPISPPPPGALLEIDERQMCARPAWEFPDAEIVLAAAPSVVALLRTAIRLRAPARLPCRRARIASPAREGRMGGAATAPRSDLRARRVALCGPRLYGAAESPRPSSRLPVARWGERATEPHHGLRLASPVRHSRRARAGGWRRIGRAHLGNRRAHGEKAAPSADRGAVRWRAT